MNILGLSAYYHDSAAALIGNGEILAAAQEERFTRIKGDASFPQNSIRSCLKMSGKSASDLDAVVYFEKPWLTFERILLSSMENVPYSLPIFMAAMPKWLNGKLNMRTTLKKEFYKNIDRFVPPIYFSSHHLSHAAAAFYPSSFEDAAVLCIDGVGEYATTSLWKGEGRKLTQKWELHFPHSLGLLYAAFTSFCGFKINSGEYKLMGLAPFGKPRFKTLIEKEIIQIHEDGTFELNMRYFNYHRGLSMVSRHFANLFGVSARTFEGPMPEIYMDLAASIQSVLEDVVLRLARTARKEVGSRNLCLAGGVALNCVANGRIAASGLFERIFIQPAAGGAGSALGAALAYWHLHLEKERQTTPDTMRGARLGPQFSDEEIRATLDKAKLNFEELDSDRLVAKTTQLLVEQNVVGWFQGRMEYGPRALGARSIIADPRSPSMKSKVNQKIKFREGFRPFAPIVLESQMSDVFDLPMSSPYMLLVGRSLKPDELPAVTHVDRSARVQTLNGASDPLLHRLLQAFSSATGCPALINTSFNIRGEPIVLTPEHALNCFFNTNIDALVIGSFLVDRSKNPHIQKDDSWRHQFELD